MIALVEVAAGALVGAPARFVVDQWVSSRTRDLFPWGTFVINASGAFVLGVITGLALYHRLGPDPVALVGTGFCGGYTTFSTFTYETVKLVEEGALTAAIGNIAGSLLVGLLAAAAGIGLASL